MLTICDIRSTNPTLLTDWKNSLLLELYKSTRSHLQQTSSAPPTVTELISERKNSVVKQLEPQGISREVCENFWANMPTQYPLQYGIDVLTWHIKEITLATSEPVIRIKQDERRSSSQVFIYTKHKDSLFTSVCSALEQLQINIVEAGLSNSNLGYSLDTLTFLNSASKPVTIDSDKAAILRTIKKNIQTEKFEMTPFYYRMPRQLKYFKVPTRVIFRQDEAHNLTVITLYTADSPGLLTRISQVFYSERLKIHGARIATLGEEAEDIFYVTSKNNKPIIDSDRQDRIREALIEKLQQLRQ